MDPNLGPGRAGRGQKIDDGFVADLDVRTSEKVFVGRALDIGKDVFQGSRDDDRLFVVSRLERGSQHTVPYHRRTRGRTRQSEPEAARP